MAKMGLKGMDGLVKKLKAMQDKSKIVGIAEFGTAMAAKQVRDEIRAAAYVASGPWTVYYGPKGHRVPYTKQAGSVATAIIMKRIPVSERGGKLSIHIVTIRRTGENAPVERAALLMEYGAMSGAAKPFFRNTFEANREQASKELNKAVSSALEKLWDKS